MPLSLGMGLTVQKSASRWSLLDLGSALKLWLRPEDLPNANRMLQTENFEVNPTPWTNSYDIVTPGQIDPTGGNTAFLLNPTANHHNIGNKNLTALPSVDDVVSCWFKRGPGYSGSGVTRFRLTHVDGGYTQMSAAVNEAWTRHEVTRTAGAGTTGAEIMILPDSSGEMGAIYAWHPQLEFGSSASAYHENIATAGGLLAAWADQSENGNNATEAAQAQMPWIKSALLDGYSAALFDSVDDVLTLDSALSMTDAYTVWAVYSYNNGGTAGVLAQTTNEYLQLMSADILYSRDSAEGAMAASTNVLPVSTLALTRVTRDGSDNLYVEKNGVDVTDAGPPNLDGTITSEYVGATAANGAFSLDGYLLELAVTDTNPSAVDAARVNNYFANKYPTLGV